MRLFSTLLIYILVTFSFVPPGFSYNKRKNLGYAESPIDNPLRGLVPYDFASARTRFPHSMEFDYIPLSHLMKGMQDFDWEPLDKKLRQAQSRGMQFNFRVWLEYPRKGNHLPGFLSNEVTVNRWNQSDETINYTPDYESPALRAALKSFIVALGGRYDTNNVIGFIHAGLLGKWGEWHTYPQVSRMASAEVQKEVMNAFTQAFPTKKILMRYPTKTNANEPFGYLDDSFGHSSLYEGPSTPSWYFGSKLRRSGTTEKWKNFPIGGEVFPNLFRTVFTPNYDGQNFTACVTQNHVSWLRDSGMFSQNIPVDEDRMRTATAKVSRMGYKIHVTDAVKYPLSNGMVNLRLGLRNVGVAPFYYDWPVYIRASTESKEQLLSDAQLSKVIPGVAVWWVRIADAPVYKIRVPNPMPGGKALRFANREQIGDELEIKFD